MGHKTRILTADAYDAAAKVLRDGGLLAFATETVYGLGADACNGKAVAGVYAAKGRPSFNPLIIHFADLDAVHAYAKVSPLAQKLAEAFWPGPLSLVLPVRPEAGLSSLVTAGLNTVAVRVPAHSGAREMLAAFGGPVAAPSANPSGGISPTKSAHVLAGLDGKIDALLEGGDCVVGLESTILQIDEGVSLLRAGGVSVEDIETVLGFAIARPEDPTTPKSPGQLASHYAPNAPLRMNATDARAGEILIGFGGVENADLNLSDSGDLSEAAANLFSSLRLADEKAAQGGFRIAVSPVPNNGLGLAINDRLMRASADKS